MFLIPLGIPEKIRSIPWGSIAIALVVCVFSVYQFQYDPLRTRRTREIASESGFLNGTEKFIKANCTMADTKQQNKCMSALLISLKKESPDLKTKSGYAEYQDARKRYIALSKIEGKKNGELLKGNQSAITSLKALFSHAGYMHLISNIIVFLVFAITLEQSLGFLGVSIVFILGGLVSNTMQLPFLPDGVKLIGASGGVSAMVGAFAVAFWKDKITVIVSFFFILNKKVQIPCLAYIILFFIISEFTGLLNADTNVAHISHLSGLAAGAFIAFFMQEISPSQTKEIPS